MTGPDADGFYLDCKVVVADRQASTVHCQTLCRNGDTPSLEAGVCGILGLWQLLADLVLGPLEVYADTRVLLAFLGLAHIADDLDCAAMLVWLDRPHLQSC